MTGSSAIPRCIDALVQAAADALPDVEVTDGYSVSSQSDDVLMIGVDDPAQLDRAMSADGEQRAATMGTGRVREEIVTITCAALSADGAGNAKTARDGAFAMVTAVEQLVRAADQPVLGIAGAYRADVGSHDLFQQQDGEGAEAIVVFRVGFTVRI